MQRVYNLCLQSLGKKFNDFCTFFLNHIFVFTICELANKIFTLFCEKLDKGTF